MSLALGHYYQSSREDTAREVESWTSSDGLKMKYIKHYRPHGSKPALAFVYLHGIESHAAWFDQAADELCHRGNDVYCLDRRGSGMNREQQGFVSGHINSGQVLLDDLDGFIAHLRRQYARIVVIGLSWGGKLAVVHSLARQNLPDGIVLVTPGLAAKVDVSLLTKLRVLTASVVKPEKPFEIPIQPEMFTEDPYFLERIKSDPLRLRSATARFLVESLRMGFYISRNIQRNPVPTLVFFAGKDRIIDNAKSQAILQRSNQRLLDIKVYEDQLHSIQFDAPGRLVNDILAWTDKQEFSV